MGNLILFFFAAYTILLFVVMWFSARKADNASYFTGNRKSPWFVVAYGMIGASLSGVTFMSVPGDVANIHFTYFGIVLGYILGYITIAYVLLPIYYKQNVTSVYEILEHRMGGAAHKTGSIFFILSRLLGSALRMYLVIFVLQTFVFDAMGIPIWLTATGMVIIILLYTFRGGIKTVVWTDTLQTTFMLTALILTITIIIKQLGMPFSDIWHQMKAGGHTQLFGTDWHQSNFFVKQIISGMFITIVMTGLDQDMMQKNLTCKNLKDAQRNMLTFSGILVVANALFLFLGGLLLIYAQNKGIDLTDIIAAHKTDKIYPEIAFNHLGVATALIFTIGLISAGYSSADGTLTALTTSVCYDLIHLNQITSDPKRQTRIRRLIHVGIAILFLITIIIFSNYHNNSLITIIFNVASYTYGPILGMFVFSIFTKRNIKIPALVPVIAILSPILCLLLNRFSEQLLWGYKFGFELLIVNGLLTFVGLIAISGRPASPSDSSSQNDLLS
ncbi:MAG: sodium:solute symporter [Bacteroidales bacterium]|nr:sodium:solute symporter [Bacteroidales bacterium]